MQRTCVIYESKYGSTAEIAGAVALVLGPARTCRPEEFSGDMRSFDLFVIGTPIYNGNVAPSIRRFVETNAAWLQKKPVAFFCTCLNLHKGHEYLKELRAMVGDDAPVVAFGGRMKVERLDRDDLTALSLYAKKTDFVLEDRDLTDMGAVAAFALALREKMACGGQMAEEEIKTAIEDYLRAHHICVLATGHGDQVRATTVDYLFNSGKIYIYSEGGEKFAHLLRNPAAAIAVYTEYTSMEDIAGLQIAGAAEILRPGAAGHAEALALRGIDPERLRAANIDINVIRITPERAEFLNAAFKRQGHGIKQTLRY
jgi:menaquinone-dependent protoporphyrinogen IX oxidase/uncharacterized protein YhbP (UPF0306 family)